MSWQSWYDLTTPIWAGMPVYTGDPMVEVKRVASYHKDGYHLTNWCLGSHTGTHVDAPKHFLSEGAGVEAIPLGSLVGQASVVDVRHCDAENEISIEDVQGALPCERILLCTGWDQYFGTPAYYDAMPGLSISVTERLISLGVKLIGIDAPNIHATKWAQLHKLLLEAGVVLVEGLRGLSSLVGKQIDLVVAPILLVGSDGAPARVFAQIHT